MPKDRMTYKQAMAYGIRFGKYVWRLLSLCEWKINAEFEDTPFLRKTPEGLEGIAHCHATPAYLEADLTWATQVSRQRFREAIIHEHLHVVMAEMRLLAQRAIGDTECNEWQSYDDAEERAVVRLERAFSALLDDDERTK